MARRRYLVAYDIREPRRLHAVGTAMKGFGLRLQYSVFICDLDKREKLALRQEVGGLMDHRMDQLAIIDLGSSIDNLAAVFEFLGPPSPLPTGGARVV